MDCKKLTGDYNKSSINAASRKLNVSPKSHLFHLLEVQGELTEDWFLHEQEQGYLAKLANIKRTEFLFSRLFIKALYFSTNPSLWSQLRVAYCESLAATGLFLEDKVCACFSLSHSGNWVAIADRSDRNIALDVQHHDRKLSSLARLQAALPNQDQLLSLTNPRRFYDLWTLKEAFAKLQGISIMQSFSLPHVHIWQRCYTQHFQLPNATLALAATNPIQGVEQPLFWQLQLSPREFAFRPVTPHWTL